jgi:DNA-binding transcriptional LysR family regulator
MDWRSVDLNLLVVFQAVLEHRGVTRAGEALGLSQPAMSANLARLRELLGDPLFVRSGTEMKPTPRALELAGPVRRALDAIQTEVLQRTEFDPATTDKTFTIVTPDIGEVNFLPRLLPRFARDAPRATLRTIARPAQAAAEALISGDADLALGYFPDLQKAGFFQQKLVEVDMVCLVRRNHPRIGERLTLRAYHEASHAVVRPDGRGRELDRQLVPDNAARRVVVEVSHFMSLLPILESTDLIAAVPRDLASLCVRYAKLRILDMPENAPRIAVHQFWHERAHRDPANAWLRSLLHALCSGPTSSVP